MNLGQLEAQWRRDVDDAVLPNLWPSASFVNWLNEAQQEACRRSPLLVDSRTMALCVVTSTANVAWVAIDPRIVRVQRVRPRNAYEVPIVSARSMDSLLNWESETGTHLQAIVNDMQSETLRTYPILTAPITMDLTVQRLPLADMAKPEDDSPEIRAEYHLKLLSWVSYRAYSVPDADAADPAAAKSALTIFEREFGRANAATETWLRQHGGREMQDGEFA